MTIRDLRNRPFLIVETIARPHKNVDTRVKGWNKVTGNYEIFERPYMADRVNDKMMQTATVIVDVMAMKCIKRRFDASPDEVASAYVQKYENVVSEGVSRWMQANPTKAGELIGKMLTEGASATGEARDDV